MMPGLCDNFANLFTAYVISGRVQHTEFLHAVYDLSSIKRNEEKCLDTIINLSDFVPEPKSLNQVIRLNGIIKEKWGVLLE